jgi:hypothetical protein
MQMVDRPLSMRGGRHDEAFVVAQHLQPGRQIEALHPAPRSKTPPPSQQTQKAGHPLPSRDEALADAADKPDEAAARQAQNRPMFMLSNAASTLR